MDDQARKERDRRLRRRMLTALQSARRSSPMGDLGGQALLDTVDSLIDPDQRCDDDQHAIELARDLSASGLITETRGTLRRGERLGLKHVRYAIAEKGLLLLDEALPPHPLVWDERLAEGQ